MNHLDPDTAALLALGENTQLAAELEHLETCAQCQDDVASLRATVSMARSTLGESALQDPPPYVWAGIRQELGLSEDLSPTSRPRTHVSASDQDRTIEVIEGATSLAPVTPLAAARTRRSDRLRRFVAPVVASAAAAALIVAAALTWNAAAPTTAEQVLASADLVALPEWAGATGVAEVAANDSGDRVLRVSLDASESNDGVREVWLLTPAVDGLISLGLLKGGSGEFQIPDSVDLDRFSVVDISEEPLDGDPTHSGDSIVRGPLSA